MRKILTTCSVLAACTLQTGCGFFINDRDDDDRAPAAVQAAPAPVPAAPLADVKPSGPVTFEGYVQSAFEVTVDGAAYPDIESFYTAESGRLPERVAAAGYDATWSPAFEAQVGLADLWREMTVYIAPVSDTGYQGQSTVRENGRFAVTLPAAADDHEYKVRANKRIAIVLTRGDDTIRICYNFSAVEQKVPFTREALPIILDNFTSAVTSYGCEQAVSTGVEIPKPKKLAAGRTKSEVAALLGVQGLFVSSSTEWCWAYRPGSKGVCVEDVADTTCDCKVTFDDGGQVMSFDDIAAWAL